MQASSSSIPTIRTAQTTAMMSNMSWFVRLFIRSLTSSPVRRSVGLYASFRHPSSHLSVSRLAAFRPTTVRPKFVHPSSVRRSVYPAYSLTALCPFVLPPDRRLVRPPVCQPVRPFVPRTLDRRYDRYVRSFIVLSYLYHQVPIYITFIRAPSYQNFH